eukprot:CAMPEP_0115846714 /NCGR_PEP_ID=MMETSP0287-20121206/10002_1 /TAXON_ID=412157 /ORGANISM="Chrysochromulina rotalis, Strain UIO044" /LENGTH=355 /DNA_ID=CAMNT_0003300511 /DNA_START=20 /DNA_END=1087 /DNA_ORIENTATION=+
MTFAETELPPTESSTTSTHSVRIDLPGSSTGSLIMPDIPKLQVPKEKPLEVPAMTNQYKAETNSGMVFHYAVPDGYNEQKRMAWNSQEETIRFLEEDEPHGRMLEVDFLGEIEGDDGNGKVQPKVIGKEAEKIVRSIFDALIKDMKPEEHEVISNADLAIDPNALNTPRSSTIRAFIYGIARIGYVPQDVGSGTMGDVVDLVTPRNEQPGQSNVGDEIRKHISVALAEVNGAFVVLTLIRTSFEEYVSTPRSAGRWLYNTYRWARGQEDWTPPTDPCIEIDSQILRCVVGSLRWCDKSETPEPLEPSYLIPTPKPQVEVSSAAKQALEEARQNDLRRRQEESTTDVSNKNDPCAA